MCWSWRRVCIPRNLTAPKLFCVVTVVVGMQLGTRGEWSRAVEVFLELQMAGLEPNRQICEALLKVLEHAKRAKQVRERDCSDAAGASPAAAFEPVSR